MVNEVIIKLDYQKYDSDELLSLLEDEFDDAKYFVAFTIEDVEDACYATTANSNTFEEWLEEEVLTIVNNILEKGDYEKSSVLRKEFIDHIRKNVEKEYRTDVKEAIKFFLDENESTDLIEMSNDEYLNL